ncbi:MAG: PorT family protein [Bacteroidetes bacterium]|nr:MAG: PorT family protein [Bacteroidota bacterium]
MISLKPINILKTLAALALLIFVFSTSTQAETYKSGIAKTTDGIEIRGSILFNPATPGFVSVMQFNSRVSTFTASQLEYFQIDGENPYVSRTIIYRNREQKVFLEKAASGKLTYLYMKHGKRFFMESHEIVELTVANILEELNTLAPGCERWQRQLENARLHHWKVRFITEAINKGNCRNIPYLAGGITASAVMASHNISKTAYEENLPFDLDENDNNFSLALFLDIPLWKVPYTHLRFQAGWYQHQFSQTFYTDPTLYRVASIQRTDLMAELLPVFQFNTETLRPYIFAGPAININLDNKSEMEKRTATQDGIMTSLEKINVNTFSAGVTMGVGLKYHYRPQNFIALEIKNSIFSLGNEHNLNLWQAGISANIFSF